MKQQLTPTQRANLIKAMKELERSAQAMSRFMVRESVKIGYPLSDEDMQYFVTRGWPDDKPKVVA